MKSSKQDDQSSAATDTGFTTRKAAESDLHAVMRLLEETKQHLQSNGIFQWDENYPTLDDIEADVRNQTLYLCLLNEGIVGFFVLDPASVPEYSEGNWRYSDLSYSVLHRLCIDPDYQGQGLGTKAVLAAESILREGGIEVLRLDAFSKNLVALRLYEKLEYIRVGELYAEPGSFIMFEKKL